jgi:tight adherence protein B
LLSVVVFVAVTASALAVFQLLFGLLGPERTRMRKRLAREAGSQPEIEIDAPGQLYKKPVGLDDDFGADPLDATGSWRWATVPAQPKVSLRERTENFLRQAGINLTPAQFFGVVAAAGLIPGAGGVWAGGWLGGVMGLAAGCIVPFVVVDARAKARRERLQKQLVGAFELMARVLRTGQSVPEALRGAIEAFDEPLASEFAGCLHQIEMGLRQDMAFRGLVKQSSVVELRLFVTAMTIHRQTGGNLSEVLERLATLVRARLLLKQRIRTLTAEGRLQSITLVVLPVVTFAVMFFLNRQYAEQLLQQVRLLLVTAAFMGVGMAWIRKILDFEG